MDYELKQPTQSISQNDQYIVRVAMELSGQRSNVLSSKKVPS